MLKYLKLVAAAVILPMPVGAFAQEDWPKQPIHVVVPFPAGGQAAIVTRLIAEKISPILGQPVLVEAHPGAGGNIGTEKVAKADADGYTWLSSGVPLTTAPAMYPTTLPFDPLADLAPVIRFASTSFVLCVPADLPVDTVDELVSYAREHGAEMSYAGSGVGSLVHLVSELFKLEADIDVQMIPYNGQPPAITDLLANRVQFMVVGVSLAQPLIEAGQLKGLAVMDAERHRNLPEVPSIAEAGYSSLAASGWAGYNVPAGTPRAVIDKINAAVTQVLEDPDTADQILNLGWAPVEPQSPDEFGDFLEAEIARWAKVVADAGVETN